LDALTVSRRSFLIAAAGIVITHHRPGHNHGPKPSPSPTPTQPSTGQAFLVGQSFVGGLDVVGGTLTGG
jgi:hypothetical protein